MRLTEGLEILSETESTQDLLIAAIRQGLPHQGVIVARHQTKGRGRFERVWESSPGESLCLSIAFDQYANHPRPWLIGMSCAVAVASALHTQVRWPNDLTIRKRKAAGVLTEIATNPAGDRIPVVGIGVNLNQREMPGELEETATSFLIERGHPLDIEETAHFILAAIEELPEPQTWSDLKPIWMLFDDTPGKHFKLADGDSATALGIGPEGELLCSVDGETTSVMAADAIFGG